MRSLRNAVSSLCELVVVVSDQKVFALLSKVSSQFDDQRGPLRQQDLELPDFLKPKTSAAAATTTMDGEYPAPLRRTDMHSSDTSLYEVNVDDAGSLERSRALSNSEERVDNLLMKQFRASSRNKKGYSIHSSCDDDDGGGAEAASAPVLTSCTASGQLVVREIEWSKLNEFVGSGQYAAAT